MDKEIDKPLRVYDILKLKELYIGKTYYYITITDLYRKTNNTQKETYAIGICKCGNLINTRWIMIKRGQSKSCGCFRKNRMINRLTTHGLSDTSEFKIWDGIKQRCLNPKNKGYHNYGERGITICDEWKDSFETFYKDMGERPSKNHSLDRIDNNGNYCKENCRWATRKEQSYNRRSNVYITHNDLTMNLKQWSDYLNMNYSTFQNRFSRGWSMEQLCSESIKNKPISL